MEQELQFLVARNSCVKIILNNVRDDFIAVTVEMYHPMGYIQEQKEIPTTSNIFETLSYLVRKVEEEVKLRGPWPFKPGTSFPLCQGDNDAEYRNQDSPS